MDKKDELLKIFSLKLRTLISRMNLQFNLLQEVRLRMDGPLMMVYDNDEYFVSNSGILVKKDTDTFIVSRNELRETMEYISNYSLYAFEEEMRQGFITIQGGHRVGIAGKAIVEGDHIKSIKHISFLNIRLAHQVKGCADVVMPYITKDNGIYHTLIISPPRCGKTTLLRDMIRQVSNGNESFKGLCVGVVDERSEIGACYMGVPQNDLGKRTDIMDCCPKVEGMLMMIRSMSPRVIAVDEVGKKEDIEAIAYVINCGSNIIATVHGESLEDILRKPNLKHLILDKIFERYIILGHSQKIGEIKGIYDSEGKQIG